MDAAAVCVAGVVLGDIERRFCVAGVALGDMYVHSAWQASTFSSFRGPTYRWQVPLLWHLHFCTGFDMSLFG